MEADKYFLIGVIDKIMEFERHLKERDIPRDEIIRRYQIIEASTREAIKRYDEDFSRAGPNLLRYFAYNFLPIRYGSMKIDHSRLEDYKMGLFLIYILRNTIRYAYEDTDYWYQLWGNHSPLHLKNENPYENLIRDYDER